MFQKAYFIMAQFTVLQESALIWKWLEILVFIIMLYIIAEKMEC